MIARVLGIALLATALAAPAAMAQSSGSGGAGGVGGSTASNGAGAGGASGGGAATNGSTSGNGGAGGTASNSGNGAANQRVSNERANGMGAIMTISPSGVREVKQALNRLGYAAGTVTGVWNEAAAQAMLHFQQAHGLEPTGNLNISSIAALGLWKNIIGDPLGNNHKALTAANSAVPPPRGGKHSAKVGGETLPSQRITNEQPGGGGAGTTGAGAGAAGGSGANGGSNAK